jgi:putative SOS response-associated peptidase YedK
LCGRFAAISSTDNLKKRFKVKRVQNRNAKRLKKKYNIEPRNWARIITNQRELEVAGWSLLPDSSYSTFNAKAETIDEKVSYASLFEAGQRCLIPSEAFYEFPMVDGVKRSVKISLRENEVFAYAGLYRQWTNSESGESSTYFTIITCEPNQLIKPQEGLVIHDRMPVILNRHEEELWLDDQVKPSMLKKFLKPYPAENLQVEEVTSYVNSIQSDGPKCWEPLKEHNPFSWL